MLKRSYLHLHCLEPLAQQVWLPFLHCASAHSENGSPCCSESPWNAVNLRWLPPTQQWAKVSHQLHLLRAWRANSVSLLPPQGGWGPFRRPSESNTNKPCWERGRPGQAGPSKLSSALAGGDIHLRHIEGILRLPPRAHNSKDARPD